MTADSLGGVLQYAGELAGGLAQRGTEVFVATMGAPLRQEQRSALEALGPSVHVLEGRFALEWMPEPWDDVDRAGGWLLEIADRVKPDLVHLNGYSHGALPFCCPTVVVAHSCVLSWWRAVHDEEAPGEYDTYRERVRQGLLRASAVVAPSHAMAKALAAHHGVAEPGVIHNGRDPGAYAPEPKHPFVLSLGRLWDEAKNVAALDDVAGDLRWPVRIAGPSDRAQTPCFRHAEYLGQLDGPDVAALLARAAIYAHPARYEPFGLSILEAALSGCALVLGDIPSLHELWGDAALFVDPDDRPGLADAIKTLISDANLRGEMARRAETRALGYSGARMTSGYVHLYRRLLSRSTTPKLEEGAACA
jgi:glycosyltransferase involved in cell wall biosynthesis